MADTPGSSGMLQTPRVGTIVTATYMVPPAGPQRCRVPEISPAAQFRTPMASVASGGNVVGGFVSSVTSGVVDATAFELTDEEEAPEGAPGPSVSRAVQAVAVNRARARRRGSVVPLRERIALITRTVHRRCTSEPAADADVARLLIAAAPSPRSRRRLPRSYPSRRAARGARPI
jgi:hypothetical protein